MKLNILLICSLVISAPAWADRVAAGSQSQTTASQSTIQNGTCVLAADNLYKIVTPSNQYMTLIPSLGEALKNPNCPRVRDYTAIQKAYTKIINCRSVENKGLSFVIDKISNTFTVNYKENSQSLVGYTNDFGLAFNIKQSHEVSTTYPAKFKKINSERTDVLVDTKPDPWVPNAIQPHMEIYAHGQDIYENRDGSSEVISCR